MRGRGKGWLGGLRVGTHAGVCLPGVCARMCVCVCVCVCVFVPPHSPPPHTQTRGSRCSFIKWQAVAYQAFDLTHPCFLILFLVHCCIAPHIRHCGWWWTAVISRLMDCLYCLCPCPATCRNATASASAPATCRNATASAPALLPAVTLLPLSLPLPPAVTLPASAPAHPAAVPRRCNASLGEYLLDLSGALAAAAPSRTNKEQLMQLWDAAPG